MNRQVKQLIAAGGLGLLSATSQLLAIPEGRKNFDCGWSFRYFGTVSPEDRQAGIFAPRGSQSPNEPANAADGDRNTRWCASSGSPGQSLVLLPDPATPITKVLIEWEKKDQQRVELEYEFARKGGNGKTEVHTVSMAEGTTTDDVGARRVSMLTLRFPESRQNAWGSVREIKLLDGEGNPVRLLKGDKANAPAKENYKAVGFKPVDLPHDWAIESPFLRDEPNETGKLPWNGYGWYRKTFDLGADFSPEDSRYYLDFDGVMSHPKVYVNGKKAGEWAYGYASFRVDITPYLKPGQKNLVAVQASNKPLSTRWYPGAGIYRHVWLVRESPVHIDYNGVCIRVSDITPEKAKVEVLTTVVNTGREPAQVTVRHKIPSTEVKDVASKTVTLAPGDTKELRKTLVLKNPRIWDVDRPELYTMQTTVTAVVNGKETTQTNRDTFGVRTAEWKPDGFYLNGRRVQLQGVCEHHDLGALGAAFNKKAWERKVRILKSMGCNSIRTSHNPPAPEALEVCDEQGMLVLDELFDIWEAQKYDKVNGYHRDWPQWWKKDVENFVKRDRNHPCVIMWSGGNEITEIVTERGRRVNKELRDEFRKYDTTRPYTVGVNNGNGAWNGFGDDLDVMGFNYKPGMYKEYAAKRPNKAFYGSETASGIGTRGFYLFPLSWAAGGGASAFQVSAYGVAAVPWGYCADVEFSAHDGEPRTAGEYVWTGFDYLGEPTPYNQDSSNVGNLQALSEAEKKEIMDRLHAMGNKAPSRSSYFGLIDLAGFPKDVYYLYKSRWDPNTKFAHLLPHWNWEGREGQVTPVMCFSSGDEAELFVNGKSQGVCRKDKEHKGKPLQYCGATTTAYRFVWENVIYEPGELKVEVKKNGQPWATDKVVTSGKGAAVNVRVSDASFSNAPGEVYSILGNKDDLCFLELDIVDAEGNFVPTDCRKVKFSVRGPAEFAGFCNGNPIDQTCMKDHVQNFFNGRILAVVRGKNRKSGKAVVTIEAEGLPKTDYTLKVLPDKKLQTLSEFL